MEDWICGHKSKEKIALEGEKYMRKQMKKIKKRKGLIGREK